MLAAPYLCYGVFCIAWRRRTVGLDLFALRAARHYRQSWRKVAQQALRLLPFVLRRMRERGFVIEDRAKVGIL